MASDPDASGRNVWADLAAPMGPAPSAARAVRAVCARLDAVVPGEWDLTLDVLPTGVGTVHAGHESDPVAAFNAPLQILGVIREGVGVGADYRAAAASATLAAAALFGAVVRLGAGTDRPADAAPSQAAPAQAAPAQPVASQPPPARTEPAAAPPAGDARADDDTPCPTCGGRMWDNRATKHSAKAPDFKCRDRACDGVIWPPRDAPKSPRAARAAAQPTIASAALAEYDGHPDDLPF